MHTTHRLHTQFLKPNLEKKMWPIHRPVWYTCVYNLTYFSFTLIRMTLIHCSTKLLMLTYITTTKANYYVLTLKLKVFVCYCFNIESNGWRIQKKNTTIHLCVLHYIDLFYCTKFTKYLSNNRIHSINFLKLYPSYSLTTSLQIKLQ